MSISPSDNTLTMMQLDQNNGVQQKMDIDSLKKRLDAAPDKSAKLREACEGFESVFIQKMWEQMRKNVEKSSYLHSRDEEMYQGMYDAEFSKKLTKAGGIGLADMLYDQLSQRLGESSRTSSTQNSPSLPIIPSGSSVTGLGAQPKPLEKIMETGSLSVGRSGAGLPLNNNNVKALYDDVPNFRIPAAAQSSPNAAAQANPNAAPEAMPNLNGNPMANNLAGTGPASGTLAASNLAAFDDNATEDQPSEMQQQKFGNTVAEKPSGMQRQELGAVGYGAEEFSSVNDLDFEAMSQNLLAEEMQGLSPMLEPVVHSSLSLAAKSAQGPSVKNAQNPAFMQHISKLSKEDSAILDAALFQNLTDVRRITAAQAPVQAPRDLNYRQVEEAMKAALKDNGTNIATDMAKSAESAGINSKSNLPRS